MKNKFFIIFAIIYTINITSIRATKASVENRKSEIDISIEELSKIIEIGDNKNACILSKEISNKIKSNKNELETLEPYYKWSQIQDLFEHLPIANCNSRK
mgnify:CR=1 FL=1